MIAPFARAEKEMTEGEALEPEAAALLIEVFVSFFERDG